MEKLSIDEVIEHCKRKVEMMEKFSSREKCENWSIDSQYAKEYWEHRQVAEWLEELKRWRTSIVNKDIKNPFANTSTLICHNCDHKDEYIVELEIGLEDALNTVRETKETAEEIVRKLDN